MKEDQILKKDRSKDSLIKLIQEEKRSKSVVKSKENEIKIKNALNKSEILEYQRKVEKIEELYSKDVKVDERL